MSLVLIAIQARSSSTRFPRKSFELIDGRTIIQHVVDACNRAAKYINEQTHISGTSCEVVLLIPFGDEIKDAYKDRFKILEGNLENVLSRFVGVTLERQPDYVVRITADCPLVPPQLIQRCIQNAVKYKTDYYSNVDERVRTAPDGHDVEVISRRAIEWLSVNAKTDSDKEHVTTLLRRDPPAWLKINHLVNPVDLSHIKISVDTPEDLAVVRLAYDRIKKKVMTGIMLHGKESIRRY